MLLAIFVDDFLYLLFVGLQIGHHLVIRPLVTTFAKTSRMVRAVFVRAVRGSFLVALRQVAKMAHEFGSVLAVVVLAAVHRVEVSEQSP